MHKRDELPGTSGAESIDRRSMIKKALAAGSIGYVAPMILGSATPASAQVISAACGTPSCDVGVCGESETCGCVAIVGGGTACVEAECGGPCTTNADCGPNGVCMTTDCCDGLTCVVLCGTVLPTGPSTGGPAWRH